MQYNPIIFFQSFLQLIRWPNLLMMALSQLLVLKFVVHQDISDPKFWAILFSTLIIGAAGYIINDYFDIKIDLVNKPQKVIIGRIIRRRTAIIIHQIFNVIGCLVGLWVSKWVFLINVLSVSLLWIYSSYFKKKPFIGNLIVAFLSALALGVLGIYYQTNTSVVFFYSLFAFQISLIREIIKDIEDIRGDMRHGCRTLPIVWGIRNTKTLLYLLILIFVVLIFGWVFQSNILLIQLYFGAIFGMTAFLSYQLYWADTRKKFYFLSQFCKLIMLVGILSMLLI